MEGFITSLFRFFASLKLAVITILLLAFVLAVATIVESKYGMRAAHLMVYGTPWFGGVLFLLGANVLCAALIRYPWKRHQTGFVVTHAGIIVILIGSFITQKFGVDGNLAVSENQSSNEVQLDDLVLAFYNSRGILQAEVPIPESGRSTHKKLLEVKLGDETKIVVDEFLPRVVTKTNVIKSPLAGVGSPAVKLDLLSTRFNNSQWLVADGPTQKEDLNLGPAIISLKRLWTVNQEKEFLKGSEKKDLPDTRKSHKKRSSPGYISVEHNGKTENIDINTALKKWKPLALGYAVQIEKYLPYAIVRNNKLVSRSDMPVNPAVEVLLKNTDGETEKHTLFANFPEFNTLHHAKDLGSKTFGVKLKMVSQVESEGISVPLQGSMQHGVGRLELAVTADGKDLLYKSFGKAQDLKGKGHVKVGQEIPTGWMDSKFRVTQWFSDAIREDTPKYIDQISDSSGNFLSAIHVSQFGSAKESISSKAWIIEGAVNTIRVNQDNWLMQLSKRKLRLPFQLHLEKFTVHYDPGTTSAAGYESQVSVLDPKKTTKSQANIWMNNPLDYGGYTFYQASYQMGEGQPTVSIFSVNYDPGRWIKYLGAILMVFGTILMFYMNPHYWSVLLGKKS